MASVAAWLPFARAAAIGWVPIATNPLPPPPVVQVSVGVGVIKRFLKGKLVSLFLSSRSNKGWMTKG